MQVSPFIQPPFIVAMIIPTGVGASIGGFAGDATPFLNLVASITDVLITHPNVANAAVFQKLPPNALYVEGYGLDQFLLGNWALQPVRQNRIGVIFDAAIEPDMLTIHQNTLNAVKTVYGLDILGYAITEAPVQTGLEMTDSGCSSGYLRNPEVVLRAAVQLLRQGATALALCTQLPELPEGSETLESNYRHGTGVDPIGGIEGILSHLVVSELEIPCAHAPVFPWEIAKPVTDDILDPRTAAEFIAPTFMPCVLTGLSRAPQMKPVSKAYFTDITIDQLSALVVPANALGGMPVLAAMEREIPIVAVEDNRTVLPMTRDHFSVAPDFRRDLIIPVRSYEEAVGVLQMMKLGINTDCSPVRDIATRQTDATDVPEFPLH
jgi:hypothetical protein